MATTSILIPVEEYLRTTYRPDCDYIDGEVIERNMGEKPHARLQGFFNRLFANYEEEYSFETLVEQRLFISTKRYRIPDVMLVAVPNPDPLIVRTPPILCIEILSSDDRMSRIRERILDYAHIGVGTSWAIDPWRRTAYVAGVDGILHETESTLALPGTPVSVAVSDIFAELDRLEKRSAQI
jgi:Uma2 family endonuclease